MMKSYLSLAIKEMKNQKVMTTLILIAIMLSAVMTSLAAGSISILQTLQAEQAASLNGDRYVTFHQMTEEQEKILTADSRLTDTGTYINAGTVELENTGLSLQIREYMGDALHAYPSLNKVKEGRLPKAPMEVALPQDVLKYFGKDLSIGAQITLHGEISIMSGTGENEDYEVKLTLCGILENNYMGYASGIVEGILGEGSCKRFLPDDFLLYSTDFKTKDKAQFQETVSALAEELKLPESNIQYNWILLDAMGISYDGEESTSTETGFSFMTFACILVGGLVLLAAGLVIYNILKISVTRRIREYGTLRAIGSERMQIYKLALLQIVILCTVAIPIGLLIGTVSAKGILIGATAFLNPEIFLAKDASGLNEAIQSTEGSRLPALVASGIITLFFAIFAALPAARYASRISPTVAMTQTNVKVNRRSRKPHSIRNFESYYARLNLKRGKGRTVITILSLVMSITVFVALQSFTMLLDAGSGVKELHTGDYMVTNESLGIDQASVNQIRESKWVEKLYTTKLTIYQQDKNGNLPISQDLNLKSWETLQIAGLDSWQLETMEEELSSGDREALQKGEACFVKNPVAIAYEGNEQETTAFSYGDEITVNGHKLKVVGLAEEPITINNEGFTNGVQIIGGDELYETLTGENRYSEVFPVLGEGADKTEFEDWLDNWCEENTGSHWLSYEQSDAQLAESFAQINMLCKGLIFLIGLIGILNIINTVYSNIHTRISEIGRQRAIGMSKGSLYKIFLWEGAYYGIFASIIGGVLGYLCTIFVEAAATDTLQLTAVPYVSIFEAALISIAACLLATAVPLRTVARLNIVESIEASD